MVDDRHSSYTLHYNDERVFVKTLSDDELKARTVTLQRELEEYRARLIAAADEMQNRPGMLKK